MVASDFRSSIMKIKSKLTIFILIVSGIVVGLGGCKEQSLPAVTTSPLSQSSSGVSPLLTPIVTIDTSSLVEPVIIPTSQPGLATVRGVLPKAYLETIAPNYATIYLGEWIETSDPKYPIVGLEKTTSPSALLDSNTGEFLFYDVSPGEYGVLVERPLSVPVLLNDPETGHTLYLKLEPGDIVDLGVVVLSERN